VDALPSLLGPPTEHERALFQVSFPVFQLPFWSCASRFPMANRNAVLLLCLY